LENNIDRFVGEFGKQVFNKDLQCANCKHLILKKVSECEIYEHKPDYVINNTEKCPDIR
jgi:hypothetical protein